LQGFLEKRKCDCNEPESSSAWSAENHGSAATYIYSAVGVVFWDNYLYRAEYYDYSSPQIFSCQNYSGKSYIANSAQIEWDEAGTATVFLEHNPTFKCDNRACGKRSDINLMRPPFNPDILSKILSLFLPQKFR